MISHESRILHELKKNPDGVPNYKFPMMGILCYTKTISRMRADGHKIIGERQYKNGKATGTWIYRLAGKASKRWWQK